MKHRQPAAARSESKGKLQITALKQAVLVTGNPSKAREAKRLCGFQLQTRDIDLVEIQSLDLDEVVAAKAEEARRLLDGPLIVEESGLELDAFNGFPGPLIKWMLKAAGPEGIARAVLGEGRVGAKARCVLHYCRGDDVVVGEGEVSGRLVLPPRGQRGFGWDRVFLPDGSTRTFGEMEDDEKDAISHRGRAWRDLLEKFAG